MEEDFSGGVELEDGILVEACSCVVGKGIAKKPKVFLSALRALFRV